MMSTFQKISLPQSAKYTIGAVCYKVQAVFSQEGLPLDEKLRNLLQNAAKEENRTFANPATPVVK